MKITNIKLIAITTFAFSSLLVGCSEEVSVGAYKPSLESRYLSVSPRDFWFGNGEESQTGSVTSENAWSFTSVPSWLSLTPSSSNSNTDFTIASKTNESVLDRIAVFYVSTDDTTSKIQRALTASQTGSSPYITFPEYSSSTITVEGKSDYMIIDVNSNIPDLTATFSQSWASASYNSEAKTVNIEVQANGTNSSRNGTLTVSSSQYSKTAKLAISQLASGVTVLEGIAMDYDADGGKQTRTIKSDLPWTAQTNYSWIEFSPKSGNAGETTMTITTLPSYESDKRIGQIYFYFGDTEKKYIGITQTGRYLTTTPSKITLSAEENSSENVVIDSNIGWEVSTCPEWLTLNQNKGNPGNTSITVTSQKNNSLNSRSGSITIKDAITGGLEKSISVVQKGIEFDNQISLEYGWQASSQILTIPFPNKWNATITDGWLSLSEYNGEGNSDITVSVLRNDGEDARIGKIQISSEGKNYTVNVVQSGQYLRVENSANEFGAMGGMLELTVATSINTAYRVDYQSSIEGWIDVEKNENKFLLNIAENPSSYERNATFVISPTDTDVSESLIQGVKVPIIQKGRSISCDASAINIRRAGGTTKSYAINADGNYSITKDIEDSWYDIVHDKDNNTFYIVVRENVSKGKRIGHIILALENLPISESKTCIIEVLQYGEGVNISFDNINLGDDKIW